MGKSQQTKKKSKWRREINIKAETPTPGQFFLDTTGDLNLAKIAKYPDKFAKIAETRVEKTKRKAQAPQTRSAKASEFDLWGNEAVPPTVAPKSHIPAVLPPHPGQSYNPTDKDYSQLIDKAAETEIGEISAKEQHKQPP